MIKLIMLMCAWSIPCVDLKTQGQCIKMHHHHHHHQKKKEYYSHAFQNNTGEKNGVETIFAQKLLVNFTINDRETASNAKLEVERLQ